MIASAGSASRCEYLPLIRAHRLHGRFSLRSLPPFPVSRLNEPRAKRLRCRIGATSKSGVVREPHHRIGVFTIAGSERALVAAHKAYVRYLLQGDDARFDGRPYSFAEYKHALSAVEKLRTRDMRSLTDETGRVISLDARESRFLYIYSIEHSSPDLEGYLHYLAEVALEFAALAYQELPLFVPEEGQAPPYVPSRHDPQRQERAVEDLHALVRHAA